MDLSIELFLKGALIGLGVAVPIGPIAIMIIRQSLTYGLLAGLMAGTAATLADGFYAWIAALFSAYIKGWMETYSTGFFVIGGLFLLYIGVKVIISQVNYKDSAKKSRRHAIISSFFSTLFMTFASPMTTLLFIGMFTTSGVFEHTLNNMDISALVLGVMVGAMGWWIILTTILSTIRKKYDLKLFRYVNIISGSGIIIFSLITMGNALFGS